MTLTDEDRALLDRIQIEWTDSPASTDGTNGMRVLLEAIAANFLRAGMERAAKMCDPSNPPSDWTEYARAKAACAAAIRKENSHAVRAD